MIPMAPSFQTTALKKSGQILLMVNTVAAEATVDFGVVVVVAIVTVTITSKAAHHPCATMVPSRVTDATMATAPLSVF